MTDHKILTKSPVANFPHEFAVEEYAIKCLETDRVFSMRVILNYDTEKDSYTNPQNEYSYCPYCGAKLNRWE